MCTSHLRLTEVNLPYPLGNEQVKVAANLLALEAIKSVTEVIFPVAASAMAFNGTGFTLALIQKKLDEINEKMDTLLDVHQKSAKDFLTTAIIAVKCQNYEDAYEGFKEVYKAATFAYNSATDDREVYQKFATKQLTLSDPTLFR